MTPQEEVNELRQANGMIICSFCDRSQFEVRKLIKVKTAAICDKCTLECVSLLVDMAQVLPFRPDAEPNKRAGG